MVLAAYNRGRPAVQHQSHLATATSIPEPAPLTPERRVRIYLDLPRRDVSSDEQDGEEARRELVLVHDVPPFRSLDLRRRLVAAPVTGREKGSPLHIASYRSMYAWAVGVHRSLAT